MRFQFLKKYQKKYNIQKAYKTLQISRSCYYDYLKRRKSKRAIKNEALAEMIEDIFPAWIQEFVIHWFYQHSIRPLAESIPQRD